MNRVVSPPRPPNSADSLHGIAKSIKGVRLSPDLGQAAAFRGSSIPPQQEVKTTPKARLRHDDSQIQFAAIESSPLQPEPSESQYLTDRQKEVKERQGREAAAMFPEIKSSPRTTSRSVDYNLPQLILKPTQDPVPKSTLHENTSPTYLPDALMSDFLGSSPTPSSKRSSDRRSDDDPPSSPPIIRPECDTKCLTDVPLANADHGLLHERVNTEQTLGNHFVKNSLPGMIIYPPDGESNGAVETNHTQTNHQKEVSNMMASQVPAKPPPESEFDIYVDAHSEPSRDKPSTEDGDIQTTGIAHSFQSEGSSNFSIEDEQVTAQLITEMERASSQQLARQDEETVQSARGSTKKRKRTADPPITENKKKRTSLSLSSQGAAHVPMAGETVADCVMIDVREADRSRLIRPQEIKRELSASPSMLTSSQALETTDAEKPPVDRVMDSTANQSLYQRPDTLNTAKKTVGRPRGSRNSQVKQEEAEKEQASGMRKSTRVSERLSGSSISSPHDSPAASQRSTKGGPWVALGKTPRRGMFRWLQRSSAESEDPVPLRSMASSANEESAEKIMENSKEQDPPGDDMSPADHQPRRQSTLNDEEDESGVHQGAGEALAGGRGRVEREEGATAQGILQRFSSMLDNIKRVTFGPEEERAAVGMLFECVKEVHEAGRRHISM